MFVFGLVRFPHLAGCFFCDFCVFGVLFVLYCTFFRIFAVVLNLKERVYVCGFLMVEMEKEDWKIRRLE